MANHQYVCAFPIEDVNKDPRLEIICFGLNYKKYRDFLDPSDNMGLSWTIEKYLNRTLYIKFMKERIAL